MHKLQNLDNLSREGVGQKTVLGWGECRVLEQEWVKRWEVEGQRKD